MTVISKAPRASKRKTVVADAPLVLNHATSIDLGDMALNDLIASLNMPEGDEVIEVVTRFEPDTDLSALIDDAMLDDAVSGAEATEAMVNSATPAMVDAGAEPTGDVSDAPADAPVKAAKTPKEPKAPKAAKVPKEPKPAALPKKHYSDKTERLKDKLGTGLVDYSVLTMSDVGDDAANAVKMGETMAIVKNMNGKAQNWAVKFVEFLAGKKSSLSEVTGRILSVLEKDGFITTGNDGNMFKNLVARPYAAGSARAMGGNNIIMLKDLKVILEDGKGRFVANPESLLLLKAKSMVTSSPAVKAKVVAAKPEVVADVSDDEFADDLAEAEAEFEEALM